MTQLQVTIRQVLEGNREAYQRIVRRYEGMLVTYVSLRVPDKSLVDELVLDTFVQAYE
jgi:DNA-directed RNA polymerase specialized sigma24 family protein